ncbi:hypothetical protein [Desertivirga brevis]|uniref:hypothetical protein n=1 Tax=Desertivirga brevis TaxID=2810310 RepID=UPI001A95D2F7|nr:hypothetical protein [Pedobacter sp. SYSU D00873]
MKGFTTVVNIQGEQTVVNVQEMDVIKSDGSECFLVHSGGALLAVVSVDGSCTFEVIDGKYTLEELEPVCMEIKQFKQSTQDLD